MPSNTKLHQPIQSTNVDSGIAELIDLLNNSPVKDNEFVYPDDITDYTGALPSLAYVSEPDRIPKYPGMVITLVGQILSAIGQTPFNPAHRGAVGFWLTDGGQILAGALYNAYSDQRITIADAARLLAGSDLTLAGMKSQINYCVAQGQLTCVPCPRWTKTQWSTYAAERRGSAERIPYQLLRGEIDALNVQLNEKRKKRKVTK